MTERAATIADLPAIAALQARWEIAWLGAVESDEDEVRETLEPGLGADGQTHLVLDSDRLVAAAWSHGHESALYVDPALGAAAASVRAALLDRLDGSAVEHLDVFSRDTQLQAALTRRGWRHERSVFDLIRAVDPGWTLDEPRWDDGITARELTAADGEAVHRLIYVDAGWAEVPGHPERTFDDWSSIFLTPTTRTDQQVLAWRGDRLVGVSTGRVFSDGSGWIAQLAVAKDERGRGLGRALLLEGLRRRRAAGATTLGLSVQADNRNALRLYLDVGLAVDREWMIFAPPR